MRLTKGTSEFAQESMVETITFATVFTGESSEARCPSGDAR